MVLMEGRRAELRPFPSLRGSLSTLTVSLEDLRLDTCLGTASKSWPLAVWRLEAGDARRRSWPGLTAECVR